MPSEALRELVKTMTVSFRPDDCDAEKSALDLIFNIVFIHRIYKNWK